MSNCAGYVSKVIAVVYYQTNVTPYEQQRAKKIKFMNLPETIR